MSDIHTNVLGGGVDFPYDFHTGQLETVSGFDSVEAAIRMVLNTRKGQRFMLPQYGSDLPLLLFEPCDIQTAMLAELYAKESILAWIPRVQALRVTAAPVSEEHMLRLEIRFKTVTEPNERMMIYPFYLLRS